MSYPIHEECCLSSSMEVSMYMKFSQYIILSMKLITEYNYTTMVLVLYRESAFQRF